MKPALLLLPLLLFCSSAISVTKRKPPSEYCADEIQRYQLPRLYAAAPAGIPSSSQPPSTEDCCQAVPSAIRCGGATCIFHLIRESAIDGTIINTTCVFSVPPSWPGKLPNASAASYLDQICRVALKISATKVVASKPSPPSPPRKARPQNRMRKLALSIPVPAAGPPLPVISVPPPPPPPPVSRGLIHSTGQLKFPLHVLIFLLHLCIL